MMVNPDDLSAFSRSPEKIMKGGGRMVDKTNPYWKELRLMDDRIKTCKELGNDGASIEVFSTETAHRLMYQLVARNCYSCVESSTMWEPDIGYKTRVTVFWD